jgi:hypothetical protein
LSGAVYGGIPLYDGPDYTVRVLDPGQVTEVAAALGGVTREQLGERYARAGMCAYPAPEWESAENSSRVLIIWCDNPGY